MGELCDFSSHLITQPLEGAYRAALLGNLPSGIASAARLMVGEREDCPASKGAVYNTEFGFVSNHASRCRVGFLFPGQGSQQLQMGAQALHRLPDSDQWLRRAEVGSY